MIIQLKPALRQLRKYPVFSLINLGGLSIGIAASFILLVYSQRELTTDHQFRDADRIARIGTDFYHMGPFAFSQPMLRPLLKATCKDVEDATALKTDEDLDVRTSVSDRAFAGQSAYYIDSSFFNVFSYTAEKGALPRHGLGPNEAILSTDCAERYFGRDNPIGRAIILGKELKPYTVIAVLHQGFGRSHLQPRLLLPRPYDTLEASANWASSAFYNYVKLKPGATIANLQAWIDKLREKVVYPGQARTNQSYTDWRNASYTISFIIQPLKSIYFDNSLKFDLGEGGNLTQVQLLGSVSILLILLAIINYVNLVTARSSIRAKEMGLKKTFGAARRTLIGQIIRESLLFSILAMFLACGLIPIILFVYQYATGAALTGPIPFLSANVFYLVGFSLFIGLLAGFYPAFYLTSERNRLTIRSSGAGRERAGIRNVLVTLQFVIATSLVFTVFIVYSQFHYMKSKDKGFKTDGLVLVENIDEMGTQASAFRQLVNQQTAVISSSLCARTPAGNTLIMGTYTIPQTKRTVSIQNFPADTNYISTFGFHLTTGRNFNKDLLSDTNSLILNESAVAALGLFDPVGKYINGSQQVIGVVKDFNYTGLREKIGPAVLIISRGNENTLAIRVRGGNTAAFVDWLKATGKKFLPGTALDITFLDQRFAQLADKERLLGNAISFFTILAILLAILGLIGLTLFTIERRTKELGIRRVLGATNRDMLTLVSGNFIRMAMIASTIALPLSWWLVNRWLDSYAYRVPISAWTFFATESLILAIAFAVISILTLKAIAVNPVKSLRTE